MNEHLLAGASLNELLAMCCLAWENARHQPTPENAEILTQILNTTLKDLRDNQSFGQQTAMAGKQSDVLTANVERAIAYLPETADRLRAVDTIWQDMRLNELRQLRDHLIEMEAATLPPRFWLNCF